VINFAEFVNSNLTNNYEMTLLSEKQIDVSWYPISFHFISAPFASNSFLDLKNSYASFYQRLVTIWKQKTSIVVL